jgi:hypothetical protein
MNMRGTKTPDYYSLLGIPASASAADIKTRYRALSKQHHPDKGGDPTQMARINQAYSILSNTFQRNIYDAERRRTSPMAPSSTKSAHSGSTRRPAPRSDTRFATFSNSTKRRSKWWPRIGLAFASIVILGGIIMNLPIAEAIGSTNEPAHTPTPLTVEYPSEPGAAQLANNPISSPPVTPTPSTTKAPLTSPAETQPDPTKNCQTKTYGPYQRTVCRSPEGNKVCSMSALGNQRFGSCD